MITLTGTIKIYTVIKKTQTRFWKDIKAGDSVTIEHNIKPVGGASNGVYASMFLVCKNCDDDGDMFSTSELIRSLKFFEYQQIHE